MKLSLFVHMERLTPEQSQDSLYREFIDLCKIADSAGMHAIWTGEHHAMNFTIAPNPLLNLVDLARQTKNVRLGTGTLVAPYWHPLKMAGEIAMADQITGGRLDVGIARGAYSYEYDRLVPGMDAWNAGQRMREMIPAIKGLWEGDYEHDGEFWKFPNSTSAPKPLQQPHPPLWVAARNPNSHEFAIENGCNVQVTPLWQGDEEIETLMGHFNDACTKFPDVERPKIMVLRHTYVGSDEDDIEQASREISTYYNYFGAWFKNQRPVSQGLIKPLTDAEIENNEMFASELMRKNNVIGSADEVIARLKHYESLGYDEYAFWIDTGMTFERKKASLERFITDVMPAFNEA